MGFFSEPAKFTENQELSLVSHSLEGSREESRLWHMPIMARTRGRPCLPTACLIRDRRFGKQGCHAALAIGRLQLIARSQEPKLDAFPHEIESLDEIDCFASLHAFPKPATALLPLNCSVPSGVALLVAMAAH